MKHIRQLATPPPYCVLPQDFLHLHCLHVLHGKKYHTKFKYIINTLKDLLVMALYSLGYSATTH